MFYEQAQSIENGDPMIRIFCFTDHDSLESSRAYADPETRKAYDRNVNEYKIIEKVGVNLFLAYQSTNRVVTVGPRDVYHYIFYIVDRDDTVTAILFDEQKPECDNKVRMRLFLGGLRLKPLKDDPRGKCSCELLLKM